MQLVSSDKYINMKRWCPRLFYSYRVLILFPLVVYVCVDCVSPNLGWTKLSVVGYTGTWAAISLG